MKQSTKEMSSINRYLLNNVKARDVQVYLLFLCRVLSNGMRIIMSPLVYYICNEFSCTTANKGSLLAAYSLGYLSTQLLGGMLADKLGPTKMLTMANTCGSIGMLIAPVCFSTNTLWFCMILVGMAQGPNLPACISYASKWIPPDEKSFASAMIDSGMAASALLILPVVGVLASAAGWRACFFCYGLLFLSGSIFWHYMAVGDPERCQYITNEEKLYLKEILSNNRPDCEAATSKKKEIPKKPLWCVLINPAVWCIFIAHMAYNYGAWVLSSWQPGYYERILDLKPDQAGIYFVLPHICNLIFKLVLAPRFFNWLRHNKKCRLIVCRRWASAVGFIGTMFWVALITKAETTAHPILFTTVCFTLGTGFIGFHSTGLKANYMDVTIHYAGSVAGFGNTLASIASYIAPIIVASILDSHYDRPWDMIFQSINFASSIAAFLFTILSTSDLVDTVPEKKKQTTLTMYL